jgi:3-deoxy-D-manno-octulosonic-acid transferase
LVPFNEKIRKGFLGRFGQRAKLKAFKKTCKGNPVAVFHCASMGEFEHTKPFINELKMLYPKIKVVVLFFSPSGLENMKSYPTVDLFAYSPHEIFISVFRFIKILNPIVWIIAKYDVWPNQVWLLQYFKIPIFLINASLHEKSSRLLRISLAFHREVYRHFSKILTITVNDHIYFSQLVDQKKLIIVGDTKFDQVLYRKKESLKKEIIPREIHTKYWPVVAGSTWPEDHQHIIPAFIELHKKYPEMSFVICPHEPTEVHIEELEHKLIKFKSIRLSKIENFNDERFIIVDKFGILAELYSIGKVAYVGGSFKQNIHNVIEPAVYQIPVIFGPVNKNLYDAQMLKAAGGGWEISNKEEIKILIEKFYINEVYRLEAGKKAYQVVDENCGATSRSIQVIMENISHSDQA